MEGSPTPQAGATSQSAPPIPDTEQTRQAAIDTAVANADKARSEADKARADAEKAEADARSAKAKATSDERDAAEAGSALGRQQRDAIGRQKVAEAEKAAGAAQADRFAAFLPDLSDVKRSELDLTKAELPLFAGALASHALDESAMKVADALTLAGTDRVLVTSDAELAASHAAYLEVMSGLTQLNTAASGLLKELVPPQPAKDDGQREETKEVLPIAPVVQALAAALPGALSLFSAHRTIATSAVTVDDLAAAAATAGALLRKQQQGGPVIVHDTFRLITDGQLRVTLGQTSEDRRQLVSHQLALGDQKARTTKELAVAKAKLEAAEARLVTASDDQAAKNDRETASDDIAELDRQLAETELRLGLVVSTIAAIDDFTTSLTAVPKGATRSPLTLAAMREGLRPSHTEEPPGSPAERFSHVLLVKGHGGSATQVIDDKPLWWADRFAAVGTAGITYMLVETTTNSVLAAGNTSGAAKVSGKFSADFKDVVITPVKLGDGGTGPSS